MPIMISERIDRITRHQFEAAVRRVEEMTVGMDVEISTHRYSAGYVALELDTPDLDYQERVVPLNADTHAIKLLVVELIQEWEQWREYVREADCDEPRDYDDYQGAQMEDSQALDSDPHDVDVDSQVARS